MSSLHQWPSSHGLLVISGPTAHHCVAFHQTILPKEGEAVGTKPYPATQPLTWQEPNLTLVWVTWSGQTCHTAEDQWPEEAREALVWPTSAEQGDMLGHTVEKGNCYCSHLILISPGPGKFPIEMRGLKSGSPKTIACSRSSCWRESTWLPPQSAGPGMVLKRGARLARKWLVAWLGKPTSQATSDFWVLFMWGPQRWLKCCKKSRLVSRIRWRRYDMWEKVTKDTGQLLSRATQAGHEVSTKGVSQEVVLCRQACVLALRV